MTGCRGDRAAWVTIGDRCTIGAGSVVTKDTPLDSVAVGTPAKVVRDLTEPKDPQDPSVK